MAKDPAFLFYPNDWIGGTMGMTFEEKGAYIELLMTQFNRGHMTTHMIGQVVGQNWDKIKDKFKKDKDGLWYNERLDIEKENRQNYTKSRNNNRYGNNQYTEGNDKKPKKKKGHMTSHTGGHMEDEDVNNITSINTLNTNSNSNKKEYNTVTDSKDSNWETDKNIFISDEQMQMNYKTVYSLSREEVVEYINKFITQIELAQDYKDLKELRKHFKNWMNKKNPIGKFQKEVPQHNPKGYVVQTPMHLWNKNFEGEE